MLGTTSFNNFTLFSCVCPKSNVQIGKLTEKINYYVCVDETCWKNMLKSTKDIGNCPEV